jgi:hypothetical protein
MVTIVKQNRFSLWRFQEIYEFPLPPGCRKPIEKILNFYRGRTLRNLAVEPDSLRFSRGSIWGSVFNPNEAKTKQDVSIRINGGVVHCEFNCWPPLVHIQIPPSNLHKETKRLEAFLGNFSLVESRRKSKILRNPAFRVLYWLYRFASGMRYRAQRRLTQAGWMVFIGIIGGLLMGSDTENTVIYQALPILVFMLFTAGVFSWFFRARFSAVRLLPRFGSVGQPFYYRVMVKNLTSKPQSDLTLLSLTTKRFAHSLSARGGDIR